MAILIVVFLWGRLREHVVGGLDKGDGVEDDG